MNGSPFSARGVLALVVLGAALFVTLLWSIGTGGLDREPNDGGGHVGGKGLNGFAGIAQLLEAEGWQVRRSRSKSALDDRGLLVLTPDAYIDADKIEKVLVARRYAGPTLLILPKWQAVRADRVPGTNARKGWVALLGTETAGWADRVKSLGKLDARIAKSTDRIAERIDDGLALQMPDKQIQSVSPGALVALIRDPDGRTLAGYLGDKGYYPDLDAAAKVDQNDTDPDNEIYPVVVVAEPDLLDNWALADRARAEAALALVRLAAGGKPGAVTFDLTLPGYGRSPNLLTLAFTPPFLAATLCLILAAIAAGWRAFFRFGPPRAEARAIAFGKRALVGNFAGLIRRSRRLHLLGAPYADATRERLARALSLPPRNPPDRTEAAIDRALAARAPDVAPFSTVAARLRAARRPLDLLRAAQDLHSLERTLTR